MFAEAAPYWNQMAEIEPGKPDSYREAATVYWDYYKFEDALRLLNAGRAKLGNENLFCYEEGAIYENERDYPRAIAEYVKGGGALLVSVGPQFATQRSLYRTPLGAVLPASPLGDVLETIYFDYNDASIREDSKAVLSKVADVLIKQPAVKIEIEGHCDVRGSTE